MGWFDEQIRQRINADDASFSNALNSLSGVINSKYLNSSLSDNALLTRNAIEQILTYYKAPILPLDESIKNVNEQLEYLLRPGLIMRRNISLTGKWYKNSILPILTTKTDGTPIALIPSKLGGYYYINKTTKEKIHVNKKVAKTISKDGICFYKPLPLKKIGINDFVKFIIQSINLVDILFIVGTIILVTLIGLLVPLINNILYDKVVGNNSLQLLLACGSFLIAIAFSQAFLNLGKNIVISRLASRTNITIESSIMMRVLTLKSSFYKEYTSGDIANRMQYIKSLNDIIANNLLTTVLTTIISLVYFAIMIIYAPMLALGGFLLLLALFVISIIINKIYAKNEKKRMEATAKEEGLTNSLLSGIEKIKLAGAEKRAFAKWADAYKDVANLRYNPPFILKISNVLNSAVTLLGTVLIYYLAIANKISLANYYGFNSAFGIVSASLVAYLQVDQLVGLIKPSLEMIEPLLNSVPEVSVNKKVVTRLFGGIEINNLSFKYSDESPLIIDNLSLKIHPGEYIALVGETGCGKSTLFRLLLGLETPNKGAIYYDGKDINSLDLKSLRRHIGTVLQNSKLLLGDIFSNITITNPSLTLEDAWAAAKISGIDQDIQNMPMGMSTYISDGNGGISGGQKQRILIARAVANKPRILIFDEATSALDNITQRQVIGALNSMKCTRLVIAHRLSTIRECSRIIYLEKGKIVEDGTFDELIALNGRFANLVKRQTLDSDSASISKTTIF